MIPHGRHNHQHARERARDDKGLTAMVTASVRVSKGGVQYFALVLEVVGLFLGFRV